MLPIAHHNIEQITSRAERKSIIVWLLFQNQTSMFHVDNFGRQNISLLRVLKFPEGVPNFSQTILLQSQRFFTSFRQIKLSFEWNQQKLLAGTWQSCWIEKLKKKETNYPVDFCFCLIIFITHTHSPSCCQHCQTSFHFLRSLPFFYFLFLSLTIQFPVRIFHQGWAHS